MERMYPDSCIDIVRLPGAYFNVENQDLWDDK